MEVLKWRIHQTKHKSKSKSNTNSTLRIARLPLRDRIRTATADYKKIFESGATGTTGGGPWNVAGSFNSSINSGTGA
jgi:hypothetical protein